MIKLIKEIAEESLYVLDAYSDDALTLVMRTGMAETGYKTIRQYGGGPALSYWQVEPATAHDIVNNYVNYRKKYKDALLHLGCNFDKLEFSLFSNIAVASAFCRLQYLRYPKAIPSWDDMEAQAKYWKTAYNTELGKGTIEHFMEANQDEESLDGYIKNSTT
tara:strand:- start:1246 stop:1731 length:486 start_codon:yes stop_codon:yes gene_type:complete